MKHLMMLFVAVLSFSSSAMCGERPTVNTFDIAKLPKTTANSQPAEMMNCDIALIVFRKVGVREFHYEPGSIDCWFSPNEHGCNVTAPIYDPIRAEYGDDQGNYTTADFGRVRKRQAQIGVEGSYSFMDWEDWGFWYPAADIMTYPFLLPPCPPNYTDEPQAPQNQCFVMPVKK